LGRDAFRGEGHSFGHRLPEVRAKDAKNRKGRKGDMGQPAETMVWAPSGNRRRARLQQGAREGYPPIVECPFCLRIRSGELLVDGDMAVALVDAYPVSPGHVLIVPRRHEPDFFRLTDEERAAMWEMVPTVRRTIERNHAPAGYNIGINVGAAAGQTVPHAHLHVIPRYAGDSADPRGGVRWVLPERARYWK